MNINTLKTLPPEKLVELAGQTGVKFHPRKSAKTILAEATEDPEAFARMILDTVSAPPAQTSNSDFNMDNPRVKQIKAMAALDALNTPEMVEEAISHIKRRVPEFVSKYDREEGGAVTWHFSCKGAVDSGNVAIPMRVIVGKADIVSRGRVAPRGMNQHFNSINVSGNSAYTNTVLAG